MVKDILDFDSQMQFIEWFIHTFVLRMVPKSIDTNFADEVYSLHSHIFLACITSSPSTFAPPPFFLFSAFQHLNSTANLISMFLILYPVPCNSKHCDAPQ